MAVSAGPPATCSLLSYKELRSSVLDSCESSTADFLNVTSLPGSPEELCKLKVFWLGSPDKALISTTKLACRRENCGKRKMKASIPEFSANLPSINTSNSSETGKPIPCTITNNDAHLGYEFCGVPKEREFSFPKKCFNMWREPFWDTMGAVMRHWRSHVPDNHEAAAETA